MNTPDFPGFGVGAAVQMGARTIAPHFYRCLDCCEVFTLDGKLDASKPTVCACDGQRLEYLGQAKGDRITREEDRCPCDGRCTGAIGPDCDCRCLGVNHGSGRLVRVTIDAGEIPRVALNPKAAEAAKTRRRELSDATEAARERITKRFGPERIRQFEARAWIADREVWFGISDARQSIGAAQKLKTHKNRLAALAKICAA